MKRVLLAIALCFAASAAQAQQVVATIKPLHSLVAAVMEGDGQSPLLLVDGKQSLHSFSLKPSQAKALQQAKLVFFISEDFETFMKKTLASLPASIQRAPMGNLIGISKLPVRGAEKGHHHDSAYDFHLWLSPQNMKTMAMEVARQLSMAFPEKRSVYFANLKRLGVRLDALDRTLEQRMSVLQGRPYVVFHDATQYFESRYGLAMLGAITPHPERGIGAKHLSELREKIVKMNARCVFAEPQFDKKTVDNLLEGTQAKSGTLDPEGALLAPGPELYFQLMEGMASALEQCLG